MRISIRGKGFASYIYIYTYNTPSPLMSHESPMFMFVQMLFTEKTTLFNSQYMAMICYDIHKLSDLARGPHLLLNLIIVIFRHDFFAKPKPDVVSLYTVLPGFLNRFPSEHGLFSNPRIIHWIVITLYSHQPRRVSGPIYIYKYCKYNHLGKL